MIEECYFEQYELGAERRTLGRTITETDVVLHAGQTGDFYPHHMDAEWCKTQEFGQRIAHGTLIFSVAVGMTAGAVNRRHDLGTGDDRRETGAQATRPWTRGRAPGGDQPARGDGARLRPSLVGPAASRACQRTGDRDGRRGEGQPHPYIGGPEHRRARSTPVGSPTRTAQA
jgi:hypothetical protein